MFDIVLSIVLLICGFALSAGGVWLAWLGGSVFYVLIGLALIVVAGLLWTGRRAALPVYAGVLVATLGWSVWEIGFDWWALSARGSLLGRTRPVAPADSVCRIAKARGRNRAKRDARNGSGACHPALRRGGALFCLQQPT